MRRLDPDLFQATGRFEPVHHRHGNIEHQNVGLQVLRGIERLSTVDRSPDHVAFARQKIGDPIQHRLVVVGQEHADSTQSMSPIVCRLRLPMPSTRVSCGHPRSQLHGSAIASGYHESAGQGTGRIDSFGR